MMLVRPAPKARTSMMSGTFAPAAIEHRSRHGRPREVQVRKVTGFDRGQNGFSRRLSDQCRQALRNGADSLATAGLSMQDVVRVVYLVHDADAFPACFPYLRDAFGEARPAATLRFVDGFEIAGMQIELELFAREQSSPR